MIREKKEIGHLLLLLIEGFSTSLSISTFEEVFLVNRDTMWWIDWNLDEISKECKLREHDCVGVLHISNGKVRMILKFESIDLWSGANIDPQRGIVRTMI